MEALIPVINKLQEVFSTVFSGKKVNLPQIVVVGSQSAGKSSVIEGIVGRDFLPRGNDIVTRRPLLIQLYHTPKDDAHRAVDGDWATFGHKPGKLFTDFEEVRQEIEDETNRTTGNKGISDEQIILKIYSDQVLTLSLIDLPGITKVPVGDQPHNIETIIRDMILSFITNKNSLILAVTPANQDFANSDALKLAREVDSDGIRTLCVLTKLDLMDEGTNAMDVLQGKVIPVKLGIIGVVNRSQADIQNKQSIDDCLDDEMTFLRETYPNFASRNGIKYLAKRLNKLLVDHIYESLPELTDDITNMIADYEAKLDLLGEPIEDKNRTFLQVLSHFVNAYISTIDGSSVDGDMTKLSGGARIGEIFHDDFEKDMKNIGPMNGLAVKEVLSAIKNGSALKPAMIIPEKTFEILVKKQIKRFKTPMIKCVDLVSEELVRTIQHCGDEIQQEMQRFPRLYEQIRKVVSTMLSASSLKAKKFLEDNLETELAFINTKHPEFIINEKLVKVFKENPDDGDKGDFDSQALKHYVGTLTYREKRDFCVIENFINQYFCIVRKSIQDKTPKAIMKFIINDIMTNLSKDLTLKLYNQENVDELLVESEHTAEERKKADEMLKALYKANDVLMEFGNIEV